jgi:RNA polymerase primary sigma factor
LTARFGLDGDEPHTLDQIAAVQGITRERIRQIGKRALALLRVPRLEQYLYDQLTLGRATPAVDPRKQRR